MTITNNNKKKVLIVSFLFPPANTAGAVRIGKLAKYLHHFGWQPIVLTADKVKHFPQTLPVEIGEEDIIRTPYLDLSPSISYNLIGNENLSWYFYALRAGLKAINKHKIDLIFSSFSPRMSHIVAYSLHNRTGIPWVADFRDLWTLNHYTIKPEPIQFFDQQIEKKIMKKCDLMITVSNPLAQQLEKFHSKKTIVIPNGFDEEDYMESVSLTKKFTITYTGSIYPGKQDPTPLFKAINELKQEGKISSNDIEVQFFGNKLAEILSPLIEK